MQLDPVVAELGVLDCDGAQVRLKSLYDFVCYSIGFNPGRLWKSMTALASEN